MLCFPRPEESKYGSGKKKPKVEPEKLGWPETTDTDSETFLRIAFRETQIDSPSWTASMPKHKIKDKPQNQAAKKPDRLREKWLEHADRVLLLYLGHPNDA